MADRNARRRARVNTVSERLFEAFPEAFKYPPVPLAIGIGPRLRELLSPEFNPALPANAVRSMPVTGSPQSLPEASWVLRFTYWKPPPKVETDAAFASLVELQTGGLSLPATRSSPPDASSCWRHCHGNGVWASHPVG
jgi:hypothetical protein